MFTIQYKTIDTIITHMVNRNITITEAFTIVETAANTRLTEKASNAGFSLEKIMLLLTSSNLYIFFIEK